MRRDETIRRRLGALAGAALLAAVAAGCAGPGPVFPLPDPPVLWPKAGDPARYAYVGKLEGEADLQRPRSFWKRLGVFIAGEEPPAKLQSPCEAAVSPLEVLYVSDPDLHAVHRFDLVGRSYAALTDAGGGRRFATPIGISFLGERPVVADRTLRTVTVLSPAGTPEAVLGEGSLEAPVGVAAGPLTGRVYVVDVGSHQVKAFGPDGKIALCLGKRGRAPGEFNFPTHVACDGAENLYVSDSLNFRVQVFDREGKFLRTWGGKGDSPGDFSQPKGIAVDRGGRVYVVDSNFENVQVFDPEGRLLLAFGEEGNGPGQFWLPVGIFADGEDRLWIGDLYNRRIQVFRFLGADGKMPAGANR